MMPVTTARGMDEAGSDKDTWNVVMSLFPNCIEERRRGMGGKTYTTGEHDSFKAFTKDRDEGEKKQSPAARHAATFVCGGTMLERMGELDSPFDLGLLELQECKAHDKNDACGDDTKCTLPDLFRLGPEVVNLV